MQMRSGQGTLVAASSAHKRNLAEVRDFCQPAAVLTMLELNSRQRTLLADKLLDIGNIAAGATVFGQFVTEQPFSVALAFFGVACWALFFVGAMVLSGRNNQ